MPVSWQWNFVLNQNYKHVLNLPWRRLPGKKKLRMYLKQGKYDILSRRPPNISYINKNNFTMREDEKKIQPLLEISTFTPHCLCASNWNPISKGHWNCLNNISTAVIQDWRETTSIEDIEIKNKATKYEKTAGCCCLLTIQQTFIVTALLTLKCLAGGEQKQHRSGSSWKAPTACRGSWKAPTACRSSFPGSSGSFGTAGSWSRPKPGWPVTAAHKWRASWLLWRYTGKDRQVGIVEHRYVMLAE